MGKKASSGRRDREATERRLVEAAVEILRSEGFGQLGVNAVADRAGVGKVLIYRYFGGLPGLLRAVADHLDPLQAGAARRLLSVADPASSPGQIMEDVVMEWHRALKGDELTKQLLIWELTQQNEVTDAMAAAREEVGLELTRQYAQLLRSKGLSGELDLNALFALVSAGIFYLTLRSDSVAMYNGIDIQSSEGWRRIGATLKALLDRTADLSQPAR
jgi:AcrR family transcriptional regulator